MSLDEELAAIDGIDDQIVALIAQRQRHVSAAATCKADAGPAHVLDRRAAQMARLRRRAVDEGADPVVVAVTYAAMIDAFTALRKQPARVGAA